jgi:site-specific recombinase XerD
VLLLLARLGLRAGEAVSQLFFTDRLLTQLAANPHTVAAYRDAFRLLLQFASERLRRAPSGLRIEDLDARFLAKFLDYLEEVRSNCTRTRNNRLAALHTFFQYVSFSEPALALDCQRILAIPSKRHEHAPVAFLTEEESAALVAAPTPDTWIERRDRALLFLAAQTGLRNSELMSLRRQDVELGAGTHVRCFGKGRKMLCTPLRPDLATVLKEWLSRQEGEPEDLVFPSSNGGRMSADALQRLVAKYVATARRTQPSLNSKTVKPHTLRHAAATALLQHGVDLSVIAPWLGHESSETTQIYLHADMRLKEEAFAHATPSSAVPDRFRPPDSLLAFLESL